MSKRTVIAVVAAVAAFGAVSASAATLGGLSSKSLGADANLVASCDTDGVNVAYTTAYDATAKEFLVSGVNVTSINAACNTFAVSVSVANGTTALSSGTGTVAAGAASVTLASAVSAKNLNQVAVVISG
jgi:X-X-X-Leu-X-X-Gly heptad repeat protein